MEGLLILLGIYALDIIIKKITASKKEKPMENREEPEDYDPQDSEEIPSTDVPAKPRSLQDLIRQFEEAQREASGGTYVPPSPEVEETNEESVGELPVVTPATPGQFSFMEIAESVVQWEYVSVELLQEAFDFSEPTAQQVLAELQAKRIVGRDMGDGDCDLLVHDKTELENHFKRLQREAEEEQEAAKVAELQARREAELKHQQELAELEERARQAREQASNIDAIESSAALSSDAVTSQGLGQETERSTRQAKICTLRTSKEDVRRGFIWAKVLDEPRFKRRWNPQIR